MGTFFIAGLIVLVASIAMYTVGYSLSSRKHTAVISKIVDDYDYQIQNMRKEKNNAKQQLSQVLHAYNKTFRVYKAIKGDYTKLRDFYERVKDHNHKLSTHFNKLHQEYKQISFDRDSLIDKMQSYEQAPILSSHDFMKTKEELTQAKETAASLSESRQELATKLKKVYSAYKSVHAKAVGFKKKASLTDKIQTEKVKLMKKYMDAKKDLEAHSIRIDELDTLENERNELAIKVEVLQSQVDEIEKLRQDNNTLAAQAEEANSLRDRVNTLEQENDSLRSLGITLQPAQKPHQPLQETEGIGKYMDAVIYHLADFEGYRGAVLADNIGLAVAGSGEYMDSLAGMAAVFSKVEERIHSLFSFASVQKFNATDNNNLTLSAFPIAYGDNKLVLTMLSAGQSPAPEQIHELITQVSA